MIGHKKASGVISRVLFIYKMVIDIIKNYNNLTK